MLLSSLSSKSRSIKVDTSREEDLRVWMKVMCVLDWESRF